MIPALILVVAISVVILIIVNGKKSDAEPQRDNAPTSVFSFNPSQISGWRQGPTNENSMALFSDNQSCFSSIEHKSGSVDLIASTAKTAGDLTKDGYNVRRLNPTTKTVTVGTRGSDMIFEQLGVTGTGNTGQLYGGQAYGYVKLADNEYLYAQVNCMTTDQLPSALSAISAVTFKKS